jgi:hypothetical protein
VKPIGSYGQNYLTSFGVQRCPSGPFEMKRPKKWRCATAEATENVGLSVVVHQVVATELEWNGLALLHSKPAVWTIWTMFPDVFAIFFGAFHVERTRRPSFHLCWDPYGWEANSGRSYTLSKKPSWRMFTPCMSFVLAVCIRNFGWDVLCCGCGRCHIQSDPIGDFTESHRKSDSR